MHSGASRSVSRIPVSPEGAQRLSAEGGSMRGAAKAQPFPNPDTDAANHPTITRGNCKTFLARGSVIKERGRSALERRNVDAFARVYLGRVDAEAGLYCQPVACEVYPWSFCHVCFHVDIISYNYMEIK